MTCYKHQSRVCDCVNETSQWKLSDADVVKFLHDGWGIEYDKLRSLALELLGALEKSNFALGTTFTTPKPEIRAERSAIYVRGQDLIAKATKQLGLDRQGGGER